ncbi:MAG: M1 family metallopeptidase [Planctomycetota bacterium]
MRLQARLALLFALALLAPAGSATAQGVRTGRTSGHPLGGDQTCYDVLHYALDLTVDPKKKAISGTLAMRAKITQATARLGLDLDGDLEVSRVCLGDATLQFEQADGKVMFDLQEPGCQPGQEVEVVVTYGGVPRVAANPPWQGGFTWAETKQGRPWIATSCQLEGADLWWPCKDHPSDEPDSMDIRVTVPKPLIVASNGKLVSVEPAARKGWHTYHWHVSTPINTYGVALNIAPYRTISKKIKSVAGDTFEVTYWVLPENYKKGKELFKEILEHMEFCEKVFGPYPFRADKYGVAETPHLGMEHQTIVAYGNKYRGNPWGKQQGFDFLHHHEFSHEWWGNLVTAAYWNDFWIHEGFGTYAQALYVEELHGIEEYHVEMASTRRKIQNSAVLAPREPRSSGEMESGGGGPGQDVYSRGSWVLHSLRWLVGDEKFFLALRRMAYPDPELEKTTDGSACRLATTDEIRQIAEQHTGFDLQWFFEVYLRQPGLPRLEHEVKGSELHLRWVVPGEREFPMPVPVKVGKSVVRVEMPEGRGVLRLKSMQFELDPDNWILKEEPDLRGDRK